MGRTDRYAYQMDSSAVHDKAGSANVVFESMSQGVARHSADIKCATLSDEKKATVGQNEKLHNDTYCTTRTKYSKQCNFLRDFGAHSVLSLHPYIVSRREKLPVSFSKYF